MAKEYSNQFYDEMKDSSLLSARVVVPIVKGYVNPKSVVDIGCGTGVWLKVFQENGASEIHGYDGSWVRDDMLVIPRESFTVKNLEEKINADIGADLCVCLEVAEHLPESKAEQLIHELTSIAPVVLFSAAIPFQDGDCHVNEQWPDYWENIFNQRGYVVSDSIRRKIWGDESVSFFYSQNILLYVNKEKLSEYPKIEKDIQEGLGSAVSLVHPHMYKYYAERWKMLVPYFGKIPSSLLHFLKKLIK